MWCLSCTQLSKCPAATGDMIVEGLGCVKWSQAPDPVQEARSELVMMLGPHSILSKPNPKKIYNEKEYNIMSTANDEKRSKLRLIAIKLGLLEKIELAKSLRWTEDELLEKLEGTFSDCRTWTTAQVDEIISDLASGKKRQPSKTNKDDSPEEAVVEAQAKESKRQPSKRKRLTNKTEEPSEEKIEAEDLDTEDKDNVKERQPASRKKRQPVVDGEPQAAVFQVDGKQLIEEFGLADVKDQVVSNQALLAGLTVESEDIKASIGVMQKQQTAMLKAIDSISQFCIWFYNSETDDEIENLSEVFPSTK